MRKFLIVLILLFAVPCLGAGPLPGQITPIGLISRAVNNGLTFWAPFTDPANPLTINVGTGAFTFTRAHDATHTATYVSIDNGFVTTASADQLRIEAQGALIEEARTNICTKSATFQTWSNVVQATVVADNAIAPDGTLSADFLKEDAAEGVAHWEREIIAAAEFADNTVHTYSIYAKSAGRNFLYIHITHKGGGPAANALIADLRDCTVASGTGTAETAPNGFCRLSISNDLLTGASSVILYARLSTGSHIDNVTYSGDNTSGVYLWGAQIEQGEAALSYIPTAGVKVTRNIDALSAPLAGNASETEGTMTATVDLRVQSAQQRIAELGNAFYVFGRLVNIMWIYSAGSSNGPAWTDALSHRVGYKWTGATNDMVIDGGAVTANAMTEQVVTDDYIRIGGTTATSLNGHIKDLRIWNRELTDAELIAITR